MQPRAARPLAGLSLVLIVTTGIALSSAQQSDDAQVRSKILALEHAWNQAEAGKDLKALDAIFDVGLVYVDYDGRPFTKAEFLAQVKTESLQQVVTESMTVQVFGSTAIATGTYRSLELNHGREVLRRGRFVDTWIFKDTTWICVAAQATPIH